MKMYKFDGEWFEDIDDLMMYLGAEVTYEPTCKVCPVCGSNHFDTDGEAFESVLLENGETICDDEDCLLAYYYVEIVDVEFEEVDLNEELNREFNKERL